MVGSARNRLLPRSGLRTRSNRWSAPANLSAVHRTALAIEVNRPYHFTNSRHALNAWRLFVLSQRKRASSGALIEWAGLMEARVHFLIRSARVVFRQSK